MESYLSRRKNFCQTSMVACFRCTAASIDNLLVIFRPITENTLQIIQFLNHH
ncbi:DUF5951 family protein [Klebsiella pneumoniae]|nr:DUF5951 family protein [Klebsiella pneumoniae]